MDTRYYQRELDHLRRLAVEFSAAHPALAPLLSGPSSDPDVERLLEGMAFLTGQLSQKLDESYSTIGERLISLIFPQLLQDVPSCTIIRFTPKPALRGKNDVPRGTLINSAEIDGISCVFSTVYPVELYPLALVKATADATPGRAGTLRLDFALHGISLEQWQAPSLRLHLTGSRTTAMNRLAFLTRNVARIHLEGGGARRTLPREALAPVGFLPDEALLPYPSTAYPGFRLLQEYYAVPEKFFFLDITGLDAWERKGTSAAFSIILEMRDPLHSDMPPFSAEDFALFATPAVNVFPFETTPITADQRQSGYLVRANSSHSDSYVPCQVLEVTGLKPGSMESRPYAPLLSAAHDTAAGATYTVLRQRRSEADRHDLYLSLIYPPGSGAPDTEVLSLQALYSNGALPERLKIGDVCKGTSSSPALADFFNITAPTSPVPAPARGDKLWSMLTHLHLNYLPMANAETLRALLLAYLPEKTDALSGVGANKKRIASIMDVRSEPVDRLWRGRPVRGCDVSVVLDESGFSSAGDMYFFSMVLQHFLRDYAAINSFVRVSV